MPFQFYCPQGHLLEGHESQMGQQSQCPMCGSVFVMPFMPGAAMPAGNPAGGPMPPGGWPGYGQQPGYGQPGPQAFGQPMAPGPAQGYPGGQFHGQFPGYPGGYGSNPAGPMPGYAQPQMQQPFGGGPAGPGTQPMAPDAGAAGGGFPFIQTEPQPEAAAAPVVQPEPPAPAAEPPAQPPAQQEKEKEEKKEPRIVRIPCPQGHELQTPMDMVNQDVLCPICGTQFHLRYEDSIEFKEEQADFRRRKAESLNQAALKWSIIAAVVVVVGILGMIIYVVLRGAHREEDYNNPSEPVPAATETESEVDGEKADNRDKADNTKAVEPTKEPMPEGEQ
jgi:ribosomal protein S27E